MTTNDDAFKQWWDGIENFATRAERLDGESPEAIARAAFFAALASSKPEPQAQEEPCPHFNEVGYDGCKNRRQCWEPCGELGHSAEHARPASKETTRAIDEALGLPQAQATNEHTEQSERAEFTPDPLEQIIDNYVAEYEFNDGEAFHTPTKVERFMIKDAIIGLIADPAFDAEWGRAIDEQAERKVAALLAADKAGGDVEYAEQYADHFNDSVPTRVDIVNAVYWGMRYTHPQPQPVPDDVVKDAERYRWLRKDGFYRDYDFGEPWMGAEFDGHDLDAVVDAAIDAAMLKEGK